MKSLKSIVLNWIGGGKTPIPVRFLKSIDVPGSGQEQDVVKPIVLSDFPLDTMKSQTDLDAIGLTLDEAIAATAGKRNCVVVGGNIMPITRAFKHTAPAGYDLNFYTVSYDENGDFAAIYGFNIVAYGNGNVTVSLTDA